METIDGLGPFQLYGGVPRRSSSVSPTEEPEPRPNKRRRVSQFFGQDSRSISDDEDDEPSRRPKHRKSSAFLSLFSLPKATRKDSKYDKMPAIDTEDEQGSHNEVPLAQRSVPYDTSDTPIEPERRRSSLARIKEFFSRKRNDSGVQENTVSNKAAPWNCHPLAPGNANPHHQMEVQYYNTSLEPLAMGTSGRYYAQQSANLATVSPISLISPSMFLPRSGLVCMICIISHLDDYLLTIHPFDRKAGCASRTKAVKAC